jgi:hypothetical protein
VCVCFTVSASMAQFVDMMTSLYLCVTFAEVVVVVYGSVCVCVCLSVHL